MLKKELEKLVDKYETELIELEYNLEEAKKLIRGYENMLCVRFCGWLNKVMTALSIKRRN